MKLETMRQTSAAAALLLLSACGSSARQVREAPVLEDDTSASAGAAVAPTGRVAAPRVEKRDISDDARTEFDALVARWEKARKDGTLKGPSCGDLADAFGSVGARQNLVEAKHNQAAVLLDCGREADAVRLWDGLASGSRPYAPAVASLGYIAWKNGDLARAETMFDRAVQIDKLAGSVSARLNLAQILRDKARRTTNAEEKSRLNDQVIRHLRAVLAIDGANLQAYATLCYFYFDMNMLEMARLVGQQAIGRAEEIATGKFIEEAAGSTAPTGRAARGRRRRGVAESNEGPKTSKEVTTGEGTGYTAEMKKNLGMVNNTLGLVWLKKKNVSEAIASFRRAIEMDPELNESRMNLAALALNFRDYKTAEENFRAVLGSQPRNYEALIGLGVALRGVKKIEEAEQRYLAAQQLDPNNPDSYFNLGLLYQEYKLTDRPTLEKAQQYYREYLNRARSTHRRREVEKRIKDIDETFLALEEAAKLQKEAEEMQRRMEEQQKKMQEELQKQIELEKKQEQAGAAGAATPPASAELAKEPAVVPSPSPAGAPSAPGQPAPSSKGQPGPSAPAGSPAGANGPAPNPFN